MINYDEFDEVHVVSDLHLGGDSMIFSAVWKSVLILT